MSLASALLYRRRDVGMHGLGVLRMRGHRFTGAVTYWWSYAGPTPQFREIHWRTLGLLGLCTTRRQVEKLLGGAA